VDSEAKTVVRGGVGIFVTPHPSFSGLLETVQNADPQKFPNQINLSRAEAIAANIRYPATKEQIAGLFTGFDVTPPWQANSIDANFPNPYSAQWTLGIQRQLSNSFALETGYVANRGLKLSLIRRQNYPDRATGIRPVAGFGEFGFYDATASSTYHSWQTSLRKRFSRGFSLNAHYTWARNMTHVNGDLYCCANPQDNNNVGADWGPGPDPVLHRFISDFLYELPFGRLFTGAGRASRLLRDGWQFAGVFSAATGSASNITQPSTYSASRPDYIGGNPTFEDYRQTLRYLNPAAFARLPVAPLSGATTRPGNVGRNAIRLPGLWNVNLALSKNLKITERYALQIRADLFNAFNHTNLAGLSGNINAANYGYFTSAIAREVQLNARFIF
jgi:hypothetical protein